MPNDPSAAVDVICPHAEGGPLKGRVVSHRYLGAGTRLAFRIDGTELAAFLPTGTPLPEEGAEIALGFSPGALHIMAAER